MRKKRFWILILLVLLLSGCTKQLKDANGKVIRDDKTNQVLIENVLCKPDELYNKYNEVLKQKKIDYERKLEDGDISKKE